MPLSPTPPEDPDTSIDTPILQMKKWRHREVRLLAHDQLVGGADLN